MRIAAATSPHADPEMAPPSIGEDEEAGREALSIRAADWVFAGPGSPSYALAHWQAGPVAAALRARVLAGDGLTVLACPAAVTAGQFALPVYEIYKAGGTPSAGADGGRARPERHSGRYSLAARADVLAGAMTHGGIT